MRRRGYNDGTKLLAIRLLFKSNLSAPHTTAATTQRTASRSLAFVWLEHDEQGLRRAGHAGTCRALTTGRAHGRFIQDTLNSDRPPIRSGGVRSIGRSNKLQWSCAGDLRGIDASYAAAPVRMELARDCSLSMISSPDHSVSRSRFDTRTSPRTRGWTRRMVLPEPGRGEIATNTNSCHRPACVFSFAQEMIVKWIHETVSKVMKDV